MLKFSPVYATSPFSGSGTAAVKHTAVNRTMCTNIYKHGKASPLPSLKDSIPYFCMIFSTTFSIFFAPESPGILLKGTNQPQSPASYSEGERDSSVRPRAGTPPALATGSRIKVSTMNTIKIWGSKIISRSLHPNKTLSCENTAHTWLGCTKTQGTGLNCRY